MDNLRSAEHKPKILARNPVECLLTLVEQVHFGHCFFMPAKVDLLDAARSFP